MIKTLLIIALLLVGQVVYAQNYHCPFHGELDDWREVVSLRIQDKTITFCGYCALELIEDMLPEIYEVEEK